MSNITVKCTISGNLQKMRDNLRSRTEEVLIDAMNEAYDVAFDVALGGEADDNINYLMHPPVINEQELSARLVMDGEDSLFIEYGAGDFTMSPQTPGSYSASEKSKSHMYARLGFWKAPNGILYNGIKPLRPIFWAGQAVKQYFEAHGHEVFEE